MEKTLLAEGDYIDGKKIRIYKTEDGKFFFEEFNEYGPHDSEAAVGACVGIFPETLELFQAAGFGEDIAVRVARYENEDLLRFDVEQLREKIERLNKRLLRREEELKKLTAA